MSKKKKVFKITFPLKKGESIHIERYQDTDKSLLAEFEAYDGKTYKFRTRLIRKMKEKDREMINFNLEYVKDTIKDPDYVYRSQTQNNAILCVKKYGFWKANHSGDIIQVRSPWLVVILYTDSLVAATMIRQKKLPKGKLIYEKKD